MCLKKAFLKSSKYFELDENPENGPKFRFQ